MTHFGGNNLMPNVSKVIKANDGAGVTNAARSVIDLAKGALISKERVLETTYQGW